MKGLRCWWLMGCLGAALFGAPSAQAAGGQISFSGAVVEPTCGLAPAQLAGLASQSQWRTCASPAGKDQAQPQTYLVTVRSLVADSSGDRLLAYFGQYLAASNEGGRATLVTQTYE
jgi:type 1 fimbria pilin